MYKKAIKNKIRFTTPKGLIINTEDLFDLPLPVLHTIGNDVVKELRENSDLDNYFGEIKTDATLKLKFEIIKDVIETKQAEADLQASNAKRKADLQKILGVIARKEDAALEDIDVDALKKMAAELQAQAQA